MQPTGYSPTLLFEWPLHDWTVSALGWHFGVVQFQESLSTVCIGPLQFDALLSAPAVASIAAGTLVAVVCLAAYASPGRGKHA